MHVRGAFFAIFLASAGVMPAAPPAYAMPVEAEAQEDLSSLDNGELFDRMDGYLGTGDLAAIRPLAEELISRIGPKSDLRPLAVTTLAAADIGDGNLDEARANFARATEGVSDLSTILPLQYTISLIGGEAGLAGEVFDDMLVYAPANVQAMDFDMLRPAIVPESGDRSEAMKSRIIRLAELDYDDGRVGWFYSMAAHTLLERGDLQRALGFALRAENATSIQSMLMDRDYEPIWEALETRYRGQLQTLWDADLEETRRLFESGEHRDSRAQYFGALLESGRYEEVLALGEVIVPAPDAYAAIADHDVAWTVNDMAIALGRLGREDEAHALMTALVEAHKDKEESGWIVSMAINLVEILIEDGAFDQAAAYVDIADVSARENGNDYARQLVTRQRFCILSRTGAAEETVAAAREAMMAAADDALLATAESLLCAGERAAAAELLILALGQERWRSQAIIELQPIELDRADPSDWDVALHGLRQRAAVEEAYMAVARDLPEDFVLEFQARRHSPRSM